jgi:hypothetical protein
MRKLVAAAGALLLVMALATPASAGRAARFEDPGLFSIFPDVENQLVVFWNITRDDYCAWEAGGFVGDPPIDAPVTVQVVESPTGALVLRWSADRHFELWTMNEDAPLTGPCEDTDDSTAPWAVGTGHMSNNDNDLDHDGSVALGLYRTNSFGDRGQATVVDADGVMWSYQWVFRGVYDKNLDFRPVVDFHRLH